MNDVLQQAGGWHVQSHYQPVDFSKIDEKILDFSCPHIGEGILNSRPDSPAGLPKRAPNTGREQALGRTGGAGRGTGGRPYTATPLCGRCSARTEGPVLP
jgi:hypothetical protein